MIEVSTGKVSGLKNVAYMIYFNDRLNHFVYRKHAKVFSNNITFNYYLKNLKMSFDI